LRRDEGESLFFFFFLLRPETLKGKKRLWWRGIGKYGRHTIPITHTRKYNLLLQVPPKSFLSLVIVPIALEDVEQ
jgi:hypothetical protein